MVSALFEAEQGAGLPYQLVGCDLTGDIAVLQFTCFVGRATTVVGVNERVESVVDAGPLASGCAVDQSDASGVDEIDEVLLGSFG